MLSTLADYASSDNTIAITVHALYAVRSLEKIPKSLIVIWHFALVSTLGVIMTNLLIKASSFNVTRQQNIDNSIIIQYIMSLCVFSTTCMVCENKKGEL